MARAMWPKWMRRNEELIHAREEQQVHDPCLLLSHALVLLPHGVAVPEDGGSAADALLKGEPLTVVHRSHEEVRRSAGLQARTLARACAFNGR